MRDCVIEFFFSVLFILTFLTEILRLDRRLSSSVKGKKKERKGKKKISSRWNASIARNDSRIARRSAATPPTGYGKAVPVRETSYFFPRSFNQISRAAEGGGKFAYWLPWPFNRRVLTWNVAVFGAGNEIRIGLYTGETASTGSLARNIPAPAC